MRKSDLIQAISNSKLSFDEIEKRLKQRKCKMGYTTPERLLSCESATPAVIERRALTGDTENLGRVLDRMRFGG